MSCYQLACGHWRSEIPGCEVGGILPCLQCNMLRSVVIGIATAAGCPTAGRSGDAP